MKAGFAGDSRAISAQVGVILMVAVVICVSVAVVLISNMFGKEIDAPHARVTFAVTPTQGGGGILEVSTVPGAPIDWSELRIGGTAPCTIPTGSVDGGDQIVCSASGTVNVSDVEANALLFSWQFS